MSKTSTKKAKPIGVRSEDVAPYRAAPDSEETPRPFERPVQGYSDIELFSELAGIPYDEAKEHVAAHGLRNLTGIAGGSEPYNRMLGMAVEIVRRAQTEKFLHSPALSSPTDSAAYIASRLRHRRHEHFCAAWLDNRHHVLQFEELFHGTVDGASVHPRVVVQAGLAHNAAAVIFAHNHPSGVAEPSSADRNITRELRDALALVGIRVLDHLVVGNSVTSMASRGLI